MKIGARCALQRAACSARMPTLRGRGAISSGQVESRGTGAHSSSTAKGRWKPKAKRRQKRHRRSADHVCGGLVFSETQQHTFEGG
jgi:hypothetical protein